MSQWARELHEAFLGALGTRATPLGPIALKPLDLDLALPLPPRVRLYLYSLTPEPKGTRYKSSLRLRGQVTGEWGTFDHSGGRLALVAGYNPDLDVFVFWDTSLHPRFKYGGNIQVSTDTVLTAAATGWSEQERVVTGVSAVELVVACTSSMLARAIERRADTVGGVVHG